MLIKENQMNKEPMEEIITTDTDLKIREELISIHAINAFVAHDSSPRAYMMSSHLSQIITIKNGDEKIIQTGLEQQFGDNTFSRKTLSDVRVLNVIPRYRGISANSVDKVTELFVLVENIETGEIDYIDVPYNFGLHQYFGFQYKWNEEVINSLRPGTILPKDTILADSPTVRENKGYAFGINANIVLASIPEAAEDAVIISKSTAERMSYDIFETRIVEFGSDSFPLNLYGDEENYKPFPDIGEYVNDDSVIMATRSYDQRLSPALTSVMDVREFNPIFDKAIYVKGPGEDKIIEGAKVSNGMVVDIKAYHSPRFKRDIYTGTSNGVMKYVEGYKIFHQDILEAYQKIQSQHYSIHKNNDLPISPRLQRQIIDSLAITNQDKNKISYSFRNEPLDLFRCEFKIRYTVTVGVGSKISDLHGKVL
jgi:hypothetical protein